MFKTKSTLSRRNFLKVTGLSGVGAIVTAFNHIPKNVRSKITRLDYSLAEKRCPQKLTIGKLMREALQELS